MNIKKSSMAMGVKMILLFLLLSVSNIAQAGVCSPPGISGFPFSSNSGHYFGTSWGGVSLDATADLMLDIQDIAGATYDEASGQIILYGRTDIALPDMDLDDLSVAVRSLFGYGGEEPQAPGVSIGTEESGVPGKDLVRYDGQTADTQFGKVIFEADWILKGLMQGQVKQEDGSIRHFNPDVPGYKSILDRQQDAHNTEQGSFALFITPDEISLKQSTDGGAMVFDNVRMEVEFEDFDGTVTTDPQIEAFRHHVTDNYEVFAEEYPYWKEVERLGKISALVKWIRDNNIPFDFSKIAERVPAFVETPDLVNEVTITKSFVEGNYLYTFTSKGGVVYRLDDSNFQQNVDPSADTPHNNALAGRSGDAEFQWNFNADGESLMAIAHSFTRSQKDGNVTWRAMDFAFPVRGDLTLALDRKYDSFDPENYGFGVGWEIVPYRIRVTDNKYDFTFNDGSVVFNTYYNIFVKEPELERQYKLIGLNANQQPLFLADGGKEILVDKLDGTFVLIRLAGGQMEFDDSGRLTEITDRFGESLIYTYSETGILNGISHDNGDVITMQIVDDRIQIATGPGNTVFAYGYDANGNLHTVTDQENQVRIYEYDTASKKLSKVIDARGNPVMEVAYDQYSRATQQEIGAFNNMDKEFSLADRRTIDTDTKNVETTRFFDEEFRLLTQVDNRGRQIDLAYDSEFGPNMIMGP